MHSRLVTAPTLFLIAALAVSIPTARAGNNHSGEVSAIVPTFSVEHDAMRPNEDVVLTVCITNGNGHSGRSVERGDSFSFDFGGGTLGNCGAVTVSARGADMSAADFACESTPSTVTLRYLGRGVEWPIGAVACAELPYHAGLVTSTVLTSYEVGNRGAYATADPSVIFLTTSDRIGSVGATGPQGAQGPQGASGPACPQGDTGPMGPVAAGARLMLTSTGSVYLGQTDPPAVVPGLDGSIDVSEGSNLLLQVDAADHIRCHPALTGSLDMLLELDGNVVASRDLEDHGAHFPTSDFGQNFTLAWLSPPLSAGAHHVRVLSAQHFQNRGDSKCVGSATDVDGLQARLVIIELRR